MMWKNQCHCEKQFTIEAKDRRVETLSCRHENPGI